MRLTLLWMGLVCVGLAGCATTALPPLAMPLLPSPQTQLTLTRLEQILVNEALDNATLAQLHYERGVLHDSLGLHERAVWDLKQSLSFQPDHANVYNVLGVHFTQSQHWDAAFDAFDSALELEPNHPYAQRNRGIALYYSGRTALAHEDLLQHYQQDVHDPYRALWLYWAEMEIVPDRAKANLLSRWQHSDQKAWGWQIVRYCLGEVGEKTFLFSIKENAPTNQILAERLTEAYFYMAKEAYYLKQPKKSYAWLKRALSANVVTFIEHRFVPLELARLSIFSTETVKASP